MNKNKNSLFMAIACFAFMMFVTFSMCMMPSYMDATSIGRVTPIYFRTGVLFGGCAALLCAVVIYWLNNKVHFAEHLLDSVWINVKKIRTFGCVAALLFLIKIILTHMIERRQALFVVAVIACTVVLIIYRKALYQKLEGVVFFLALILGSIMIATFPLTLISMDEAIHYDQSLQASFLGNIFFTDGDFEVENPDGIFHTKGNLFSDEDIDIYNAQNYALTKEYKKGENYQFLPFDLEELIGGLLKIKLYYLPYGLGIAFGRMVSSSFYVRYMAGEFCNLLLYAAICFFAVRKLKSGKLLLGTILLCPQILFHASTYHYDTWVIAFIALGTAWYIGENQRPEEKVSYKDAIIMSAAFALACMPKQVYFIYCFLPFLMPWKKIENKLKYYFCCTIPAALLMLSFALRSVSTVGGVGDTRGGTGINPAEQVHFILSYPVKYLCQLSKFLFHALSFQAMKGMAAFCDYAGSNQMGAVILSWMILLLVVIDKYGSNTYIDDVKVRVFMIASYFICGALAATAMYIVFNPVGAGEFAGTQPRYFIPAIYPMLAYLYSGRWTRHWTERIDKNMLTAAVMVVVCVIGLWTSYDIAFSLWQ